MNPLRGQNNVQGASDAACLPNVYPGYQKVDDPAIQKKFEEAWGVELSPKPGLTATEMMNAAADGTLKAMYIMGENPVITDPNMHHTIKALNSLEFLIVQDIFMTETAQLADVIFPATCSFEKDGTFTNTERKVQRVRKVVDPPAPRQGTTSQSSAECHVPCDIRWNTNPPKRFWRSTAGSGRPSRGISYDRIKTKGIAWPCPQKDHPGTPYLYKDGFPKGKVPFVTVPFNPPAEVTNDEYPFILTTGRNLFQYHSGSMTQAGAPDRAARGRGICRIESRGCGKDRRSEWRSIRVRSRRGKVEIKARITNRVSEGTVFIPMHYREAAANVITNDALDPVVKIPEFKVCAVSVEAMTKAQEVGAS